LTILNFGKSHQLGNWVIHKKAKFGQCYHSHIGISYFLAQSDPIKWRLLYTNFFLCFRVLEAEVATTISRGDTFVLLADRHDVALGQRTQSTVQQLRQQWQMLRQQAERKKSLAKTYEDKLTQFR
jgi:hypothetical protein